MRYNKARLDHGLRIIFIHKLKEGQYANRIFITELTDNLYSKLRLSYNSKTVYWLYEDLHLVENLII